MDNRDSMYAAAERLVTNMCDDGLSIGMLMRMMGCTAATAVSLISKLERNGVVAPGVWGRIPLEFGLEPLSARVFKLKPEYEACHRCGGWPELVDSKPNHHQAPAHQARVAINSESRQVAQGVV